jgi:hypothetical protein
MKRALFLCSLVFICLAAERAAFGQSQDKSDNKKACPFSIVGLWRMEGTTEMTRLFFDFSPEGYITLMAHSPGTLPQDFNMEGSVNYKLDKPGAPKRIEFINTRGNDAFLPGITQFDIIEYGEKSFTTQEPATGRQTRWVREQVRRYFLTFAAGSKIPRQEGPVLAMLTVLDGRKTDIKALGVRLVKDETGKTSPAFGEIPAEVYDQFTHEGDKKKDKKDSSVIMRIELTQTEYEGAQKLFETWERLAKDKKLPDADPYVNAEKFLVATAEGLNECKERVKLSKIATRDNLSLQLLGYIRAMRDKNRELHVSDAVFPWVWKPVLQLPGQ